MLHNLILLCQKNIRLISTHYFILKIPNKQELQQTAFNHSSDIDFRDFMNIYKKCTAKPRYILEGFFWKEYKMIRLEKKLLDDINREIAKILALSSGKIDKYEYFTWEEILPPDQRRMIEQAKFTYSFLGKAFEKETKTFEDQREKQISANEENNNNNKKNNIINNLVKVNYCFQRKKKYLRIFKKKDSIKQVNYLKQLIMVT